MQRILVWSAVATFSLLFLVFALIFIIFPIVFWLCYSLQRFMTFVPINSPKNPDFDHPEIYGINGTVNFYRTVTDYDDYNVKTRIGAWFILHKDDVIKYKDITADNIPTIINSTGRDVLFYSHGVAENRAKPIHKYEVFRNYFHVISVDHRKYGDSGTNVDLNENAIINDHIQIFQWLRSINTTVNIYYWGHSLGTGISCHLLSALKTQCDFIPKGLVLESPFSTMPEEAYNLLGKVFGWLAYFNATMIRPIENNGIHFYSTKHILNIYCPIMILHAEDDPVISPTLSKKLYDTAVHNRLPTQGNVSYYVFPKDKNYGHNDITNDPSIPQRIEDFKAIANDYVPPPNVGKCK